jgi:cobalt-zinc-cadmium efflux system outer membrane protein
MFKLIHIPFFAITSLLVMPAVHAQQAIDGVPVPQAVAPTEAMTLSEAEAIAASSNLQIAQAVHQIASAHDNLVSQRAPINPTIAFSGLNNTVAPTAVDNTSNYVGYLTLETNGAQRFRTGVAGAQLQSAQADAKVTALTVRQAVGDAYSALQVANSSLENEREVYALVNQLRDLTQKQFDLGAAPQTNAIRASVALTTEQQNLIAAVSQVEQARIALNVVLGRSPDAPVDASEPLAYKPVTIPSHADLLAEAVSHRPEIVSANANLQAARANIGLQRSQYLPNLVLGSALRPAELEVGFVIPIDLGSVGGAVAKAKDDVRVQEDQVAQQRQQVATDVENAYVNIEQASKAVDLYNQGVLPQSESLLQKVTKGFGLGASTILDVIDAQQTFRTARNSYYAAIGSYNQAVDQLSRALGESAAMPDQVK